MGWQHLVQHQWQKGQSGFTGQKTTVKGIRPVSRAWFDEMSHYLVNEPESVFFDWLQNNSRSAAERMASKLVQRAYLDGDPAAMKMILEMIFGRAPTKLEVTAARAPSEEQIDEMSREQIESELKALRDVSSP